MGYMSGHPTERQIETVSLLVSDLYEVDAVYRQGRDLVLSLSWRYAPEKSKALLKDRLETAGYTYSLSQGENLLLVIDPKPRLRIPRLNVILFLATLVSIYIVPVFLANLPVAAAMVPESSALGTFFNLMAATWQLARADLAQGANIRFTLAMVSILLVHEMGHFVASRRRSIVTSWPYFIPAPNIIGSFGAVIKSKSPFRNRRDLIEVGAAGPIAGWIVALFFLLYGLTQTGYYPAIAFTVKEMAWAMEGESILMRVATHFLVGAAPEGYYYRLSEFALAGWVGLLVTAINLLPIGQLDGGHILYGLFRRYQHGLAIAAMVGLIVLGFRSYMWWVFAGLGMIFGVAHPPTLDDDQRPSRTALVMGIVAVVILVLSFTPMPFRSN